MKYTNDYIWLKTLNDDIILQNAYLIDERDDLDDIIAQLICSYMANVGKDQPEEIRDDSLENIVRYTVFADINSQTVEPGRIVYDQIINPYEFEYPDNIQSFIDWALDSSYYNINRFKLNIHEIDEIII